jgi:hypothetical protein
MVARTLVVFAALTLCPALAAAALADTARSEIAHLLGQLERSGCEFRRNGDWYSAIDARAHLDKKYHYLLDRDLISKAEDFIEQAASRSSMSGKVYEVRCGGEPITTSAQWLARELQRYRERNKTNGGGKP